MPETTSPAYEIARWLEDQGVGVWAGNSGWSLSVGQSHDDPDTTITIQDEGGTDPDTDELDIQELTLQIRVRSDKTPEGYNAAYAKQAAIRELLIQTAPLATANMYFIGVRMVGAISALGRDSNDRHILMATYSAQRQA